MKYISFWSLRAQESQFSSVTYWGATFEITRLLMVAVLLPFSLVGLAFEVKTWKSICRLRCRRLLCCQCLYLHIVPTYQMWFEKIFKIRSALNKTVTTDCKVHEKSQVVSNSVSCFSIFSDQQNNVYSTLHGISLEFLHNSSSWELVISLHMHS